MVKIIVNPTKFIDQLNKLKETQKTMLLFLMVHENPVKYPDLFMVEIIFTCKHSKLNEKGYIHRGDFCLICDSLAEIKKGIPDRYTKLPPEFSDDGEPSIIETYIGKKIVLLPDEDFNKFISGQNG